MIPFFSLSAAPSFGLKSLGHYTPPDHLALGMKIHQTCRRARDAARKAAHIISAWSPGEKLTPGVCMVGEKSNEIPAVPELLDLLGATLKGTVVTAGSQHAESCGGGHNR